MRARPGEKKTSWLVVKNRSSGKLPEVVLRPNAHDLSVKSGRSMDEIAAGVRRPVKRSSGPNKKRRQPRRARSQ